MSGVADPDEALIAAIAEAILGADPQTFPPSLEAWIPEARAAYAAMVAHLGLVEQTRTVYEVGYFTPGGFAALQYEGSLRQCEDVLRSHPEWFNPESRILSKTSTWLQTAPRGEWTEVDHGSE